MSFIWTFGERPTDDFNNVFEEAWMRPGANADTNYSDRDNWLMKYEGVSADVTGQTIVKIDLSALSTYDLTVEDASLFVEVFFDSGIGVNSLVCDYVTRNWVEASVTWNDYDGVNPWSTAVENLFYHERGRYGTSETVWIGGSTGGTVPYTKEITGADLISYIQDVLDGVLETPANKMNLLFWAETAGNQINFRGSRYATDPSVRPYLSIQFAGDPPGQAESKGRTAQSSVGLGFGPGL